MPHRRYDLTQLNSIIPDLYLVVHTAEKLKIPVGQVADQISCLVYALPRLVTKGVWNECLSG